MAIAQFFEEMGASRPESVASVASRAGPHA